MKLIHFLYSAIRLYGNSILVKWAMRDTFERLDKAYQKRVIDSRIDELEITALELLAAEIIKTHTELSMKPLEDELRDARQVAQALLDGK